MYDKLRFWIDMAVVGGQAQTIANNLDRAHTHIDCQTGEENVYGSIMGLKVSIYASGVSVVGSLPKFLYGSNIYPLDRHSTADAVAKLSDTLHVDANKANVTSLEFGTTFLMKKPVADYLPKLVSMPRLDRYSFNTSTLYFKGKGRNPSKVFAFYDKAADIKDKGMMCPEDLKQANLLRYEMRINNRLAAQLGLRRLKASTLAEKPFYRQLVKRYQNNYFSIQKLNQMKANAISGIRTVKDAYDVLVARLITESDNNAIKSYIDELKAAGVFDDRKNYTRLKSKLQDVASKADFTVTDDLIKELDNDIKNCGAYV